MDTISRSSVVRQVIGAGGFQALGQAVSFLGIIAYTNLAPISIVGSYFLFFGLARVLTFLGSAGTAVDLVRRINQAPSPNKAFSTALFFLVAVGLALLAGVVFFAPVINSYVGVQIAGILALFIPIEMASLAYLSALKGEQKNVLLEFAESGRKIVMYAGGTVALVFGIVPIVALVGGAVGSRLLQLLFMIVVTDVRVVSSPRVADVRSLIYDIRHTTVVSIGDLGQEWIDTLLIGVFLSQGAVAVYEVAWRFSGFALILTNAVTTVLYPRLSALVEASEYQHIRPFGVKGYFYTVTPIIALFAGGVVLGEQLVSILYGVDYIGAFLPFIVLLAARVFYSIRRIAVITLYAVGHDELVARVSIAAVVLNVLLNVTLIPLYGINGAAVGSLCSYALLGIVTAYYVQNEVGFRPPIGEFLRVSLAAGIMFVPVWTIEQVVPQTAPYTFALVGLGALVYFVVLPVVSPTTRADVRWVVSRAKG